MRLWHKDLIPYLPNSQLVAQWRELNSIFKKQDKHILINYIYKYDKLDLFAYTMIVIEEMKKRNFKIKSYNNMNKYFDFGMLDYYINSKTNAFKNHHDYEYLLICYYNLKEKYIRGQKDFSKLQFEKIKSYVLLGKEN